MNNDLEFGNSSDSDEITCSICLESLVNTNYATTDDAGDVNAKCCIKCIKDHMSKNGKSLISRKQVASYTIYDPYGVIIQKIIISKNNDGIQIHPVPSAPSCQPIPSAPPYQPVPSAPPYQPGQIVPLIPNIELNNSQNPNHDQRSRHQQEFQQQLQQLRQQFQDAFDQQQIHNAQVENKWKIRKRVMTIIVGSIWAVFMVLFTVFLAKSLNDAKAYAMLGIAGGALITGIILSGIMDCRKEVEKM